MKSFIAKRKEAAAWSPFPVPRFLEHLTMRHDLLDHVFRCREVLQRIQVTGHSRGIEAVDVDVDELRTEESAFVSGQPEDVTNQGKRETTR